MSLIKEFLDATDEAESPKAYFYWSFLASIAAVSNNHVYLERYFYQLYPNIYVLLFGKSGLRKGVPIDFAKNFVRAVNNTRVISGRNSIQSILQQLGRTESDEGRPPLTDAIGFVTASEFASALVEDDQALTILTDLYDGHYNEEYKNTLKTAGTDKLNHVNLTMLGGINSPHFKSVISNADAQGGFIARTFIIYETKRNRVNSLVNRPIMNSREILDYFVPRFIEMGAIKGQMLWTPDARVFYDEWYKAYAEMDLATDDETGTMMRLGDHVLKVGMLLAISDLRLELQYEDVAAAVESCTDFSTNAKRVTSNNEKESSPLSKIIHKVNVMIYKAEGRRLSRRQILQQLYGIGVTSSEVDICLSSLVEMGFLSAEGNKHDVYYTMLDNGVGQLESMMGN